MDNKKEKTFADLFSSANYETESTDEQIMEEKPDKKDIVKEEETITFDNLFGELSKEESATNAAEKSAVKTFADLTSKALNDSNSSDNSFVNSNSNTTPPPINSTVFENSEVSTDKLITQESEPRTSLQDFNPFFDKEEETIETKNTEEEFNNNLNPFFEEKEKTSIENESKEEPLPPKIDNSISEDNQKISANINPFFEDTKMEEPTKSKEPQKEISFDMDNPFFNKEDDNAKEEITIEDNPFFNESDTPETNENINKEEHLEISNLKEPPKEEPPKSTSPFFEEETEIKENPLFVQQINLIENQTPVKPQGTIDIAKSKHYDVKIVKKKEPLIKLILGVLSYAVFIFLLLVGVALLFYVLDTKVRAAKGDYSAPKFNAYVVLTGSMLPDIKVYDVVITKRVEPKKLKEKDVITFASSDPRFLGTIITHRIIKKNPPSTENEGYTFQTKGDNNNVEDSALVEEKNIFGKVILKIPKLGYLQEFLAKDSGWIIVILIPCLTVISYDIAKLAKGLRRKKYKNIKVQK